MTCHRRLILDRSQWFPKSAMFTDTRTHAHTCMHARTHVGKGVIMTIMVLVVLMMMDID